MDEWWVSPLAGLARGGAHAAVLAVTFYVLAGVLGREWGDPRRLSEVAFWGAALIAVPQVVTAGAGGRVSVFTEVLLFTLVPAIVMVVEAQQVRFGNAENPLARLGPAIAGVGGAALILPFALPESAGGRMWLAGLVASAVLSGVAAMRLHGLVRQGSEVQATAVICGACAVLCGFGAVVWQAPVGSAGLRGWLIELAVCLLVDGPVFFLLVWLVRGMRPVAFAARFLLIPAVTVIEGVVLLRPELNWTLGLGLALLIGGGSLLLRRTENLV